MAVSHIVGCLHQWFFELASALDPRSAPRFMRLLGGALLATGRRTVTSWIRAAGLSDEFRPCYTTISAAGKRAKHIAAQLLLFILRPLLGSSDRLVFAIDDTPTPRYGPWVEGAGVHHNPTPGPANSPYVYGHVWVVLAVIVGHPWWGVIALPLLARLYIRQKDLPTIEKRHRPAFATKLTMAVELLQWVKNWLGFLGKALWVVADGAYAKEEVLLGAKALFITVVSRLRKDAALWSVPGPRPAGKRGPKRIYGEQRISLAKRAAQSGGWQTETFTLYGKSVTKRYKTFEATWRPARGVIRVVLVDEPTGWVAYFCTDPAAMVADILGLVADRFSLECAFKDVKEVVGAGQQQVRHIWANIGAFHVCLWTYTLTEAWAWQRDEVELTAHRANSPWDDKPRRPSHADKRRAIRREIMAEELTAVLGSGTETQSIRRLTERLLHLAA